MRLASTNDNIFDKLMTEDDKIVFNLFELIRENNRSFIATDDSTYIFAQNSRRAPSWLFLTEAPEGKTFDELVTLVSGMVGVNALFKINTCPHLALPLLDRVSEKCNRKYVSEVDMEVYTCDKLIPSQNADGKMITPREEHRQLLSNFVVGMLRDSAGLTFGADDNDKFTSALLSSPSVFLWENSEERIVSMAKIAHKTDKHARLNAIFTDTDLRGNGYTKTLISMLTESILADGLIPLIYADRLNTDKNKAYTDIGYRKVGEVSQFAFNQ